MNRYRLRFLLQEIDLPQGETLIGRSATCQVTLDDPLVSREHARIRIADGIALIEDLGSRNGVQVGGVPVERSRPLVSGDRIRVGTQELVFLELPQTAERKGRVTRNTGFMVHCAACGRAYPAELVACPNCGSRDKLDEDTLTGSGTGARDWALELALEAVTKAEASGSPEDRERVLRHARFGIEQRLAEGLFVARPTVDLAANAAARLAAERGVAEWGRWALSIYASLSQTPPLSVAERLASLHGSELASLEQAARRVVDIVASRGGPNPEERASFERLCSLCASSGAA